jgi:hypothetical protein
VASQWKGPGSPAGPNHHLNYTHSPASSITTDRVRVESNAAGRQGAARREAALRMVPLQGGRRDPDTANNRFHRASTGLWASGFCEGFTRGSLDGIRLALDDVTDPASRAVLLGWIDYFSRDSDGYDLAGGA